LLRDTKVPVRSEDVNADATRETAFRRSLG
jgi:hypothetical protein